MKTSVFIVVFLLPMIKHCNSMTFDNDILNDVEHKYTLKEMLLVIDDLIGTNYLLYGILSVNRAMNTEKGPNFYFNETKDYIAEDDVDLVDLNAEDYNFDYESNISEETTTSEITDLNLDYALSSNVSNNFTLDTNASYNFSISKLDEEVWYTNSTGKRLRRAIENEVTNEYSLNCSSAIIVLKTTRHEMDLCLHINLAYMRLDEVFEQNIDDSNMTSVVETMNGIQYELQRTVNLILFNKNVEIDIQENLDLRFPDKLNEDLKNTAVTIIRALKIQGDEVKERQLYFNNCPMVDLPLNITLGGVGLVLGIVLIASVCFNKPKKAQKKKSTKRNASASENDTNKTSMHQITKPQHCRLNESNYTYRRNQQRVLAKEFHTRRNSGLLSRQSSLIDVDNQATDAQNKHGNNESQNSRNMSYVNYGFPVEDPDKIINSSSSRFNMDIPHVDSRGELHKNFKRPRLSLHDVDDNVPKVRRWDVFTYVDKE